MAVTPEEAKQKYSSMESERLKTLEIEFKKLEQRIDEFLINSNGKGGELQFVPARYLDVARIIYPSWDVRISYIERTAHPKGDTYTEQVLSFTPKIKGVTTTIAVLSDDCGGK